MYDKNIHNIKDLKDLRREMRKTATPAEDLLWQHLRRKNLGVKFHRQFGLGRYIVDFCCWNKKIIIEVDGEIHLDQDIAEGDKVREDFLFGLGFIVLRFKNEEILKDIDFVLERIKQCLNLDFLEIKP